MSTTVLAPSGLEISSSHEDVDSMLAALTTPTKDATPRVLRNKGVEVKPETEKPAEKDGDDVSEHAKALGKRGGEAAAKARKAAEKDADKAKAAPADKDEQKAKPAGKDAPQGDEKADPDPEPQKADADAQAGKDKPLGPPRSDPRARIAQLARERDEAKARADRLEREAAEARRAPAAREERPTERPAPAAEAWPGKPKLADFLAQHDNYDEAVEAFTDARDEWNRREWQRQSEQETRQRRTRDYISSTVGTFQERITGHKPGDPQGAESYKQFMSELPDALVSRLRTSFQLEQGEQPTGETVIADRLLRISNPREVLEHFADNLDEFQRIAALQDPLEIAGEVAILSKRLDAATADTSSEREVSRAGTPPRSVGGSPHVAEPELTGDISLDEFVSRKKRAAR